MFAQGADCVYRVAVFALGITGVTYQQYELTFEQYFNEVLSGTLGCYFNVIPFYATTDLFEDLAEGDIDFAFVDPSTYACISVSIVIGLCYVL